jgi:multidrug efflux pump subunit AcrA (membrane-fusion protein)
MTLVGKIFTVLILLMSVVFMSFAVMVFATHQNWKDQVKNPDPNIGYEVKLKNKTSELANAKLEHDRTRQQLALEQASRRQALAALQTRLNLAEDEVTRQTKELSDKTSLLQTAQEGARIAQERLVGLETENAKLRKETQLAQLDRDTQFSKVVELTDRLNQDEVKRQALEERSNQLNAQLAQMKMVMDAHGLKPDSLVSSLEPINLNGIVLVVGDKDLVEISVGKDDGLREGHIMEVYRGDTYIGQIKIMKVGPDRAVGQINKDLKRGQVRKGDHVTTKFS